jgi:Tfp pilus assembly protein FimT
VLTIVAIFAALAAPRYGRASARYRADLAARRIAADLCLARSCAKVASAPRTVSFSVTTKQYQLLNVPAPDGMAGDYTVVLSSDPYRANLVSTSFSNAQVIFNGWGLPDNGGIVVVSAGSEQRTVVVEASTGRVSIQ